MSIYKDTEKQMFGLNSPYENLEGWQAAYDKLAGEQSAYYGSTDRAGVAQRLDAISNQFKTLYNNFVGRAPSDEEINKFLMDQGRNVIANTPAGRSENSPEQVRNQITQYIGDTFQQAAQDTARTKLSDLSSKAGSLADQFLQMGRTSLGTLADDLRDYQTRLFDKLRPQLSLAAQAGGFADSGGQTLQEQGALKDLATEASGYLVPLKQQLEEQANAIRYGGLSDPYSLSRSFTINQPGVLSDVGRDALDANYKTFLTNLDFAHQMALLKERGGQISNLKPSFGTTLGQGFANQFGGNLADIAKGGIQGGLGKLGFPMTG